MSKVIWQKGRIARAQPNVEGDQGLGPNSRALAPRARPQAGVGAGGGRPLPLWGPGVSPWKIFENPDTKSCILLATTLISGLLGRLYPSKQTCQGLNQSKNFNFSAMVAPLVVRTKNIIVYTP